MDKLNSGLYTAEEIINDVGKVSRMPHKDLGKWNWDIKTRIRYSKKIIIGVTECKELFGEAIIKKIIPDVFKELKKTCTCSH